MKSTVISIVIALALIGGAIALVKSGGSTTSSSVDNVSVIDGKQVIEITAKGGYSPRNTSAKAGVPTVIKMKTEGSYDCSIAVSIPSIKYRENLPPSGIKEIEVPAQDPGTKLQGVCAMGMYGFSINFN